MRLSSGKNGVRRGYYLASAINSISTRASSAASSTAKAERAGKGAWKNSAYDLVHLGKSAMSAMRTVVLTTSAIVRPSAARIALALLRLWRVSSLMPPQRSCPWRVDGELTTDEHYVAGTNGLAVRADGCGSHV